MLEVLGSIVDEQYHNSLLFFLACEIKNLVNSGLKEDLNVDSSEQETSPESELLQAQADLKVIIIMWLTKASKTVLC